MLKNSIVYSILLVFLLGSFSFAQEQFTPLDKSDKENLTGFIYDSKGKHNPFIPLVTPDGRLLKLEPQTMEGLLLEGIVYDKDGLSYAVVNGEIVKLGDEINGYQVLKIKEDRVTFIKEGQPIEVELKKEEEP